MRTVLINSANKLLNKIGWGLMPFPNPPTLHNLWQYALYCELIQETKDVHGAVLECGVAFGRGVLTLLHAERSFGAGRRVYGFDTFTGYPAISQIDNQSKDTINGMGVRTAEIKSGALFWSKDDVIRFIRNSGLERETIANLKLIEGDVSETLPKFTEPVALAILEMDLYQSTKGALLALKQRMAPGGIIAPLNYGSKFRATETAVKEVLPGANLERAKTDPTKVFIRF